MSNGSNFVVIAGTGGYGNGLDSGLAPNRWQAIILTNADLIHWRIYAALGGDELYNKYKCGQWRHFKPKVVTMPTFIVTDVPKVVTTTKQRSQLPCPQSWHHGNCRFSVYYTGT